MNRTVISTPNAPAAVGPYSQAIKTGNLVFVSGQLGIDPKVGKLVEGDVADQARQCLENMKAILTAAGGGLEQVVKCTVLLASIQDFATVNKIYAEYFPSNPPARAAYQVAALPLAGLVEIEAIAVVG